jgi:hypothetical protein
MADCFRTVYSSLSAADILFPVIQRTHEDTAIHHSDQASIHNSMT